MICEGLNISRETYLAIMMDRAFKGPVIVASPEGGVDIEEVAEQRPEKILTVCIVFANLYVHKCGLRYTAFFKMNLMCLTLHL